MTEQYAYGLVVAVAFNAACRKVVMRNVPLIRWNKSWMPHQKMCRKNFTQWVIHLKKKIVTHRFEPTSKYVLLFIGGLALSLVISIWGNFTQWREYQDWEEADLKYRALKMVLPSDDPKVRYIESHNMTWQETCLIWFHIWILLFHSVFYILFLILRPYYSYHK